MKLLRILIPPKYSCYLFLGRQDGKPLWHYDHWKPVAESLDPIFESIGESVSLRPSYADLKYRNVKFKGVRWSDRGHRKWCLGTSETSEQSDQWRSFGLDVSSPSLSRCEMDSAIRPVLYLDVQNQSRGDDDVKLDGYSQEYDQSCAMLIKEDFAVEHKDMVSFAARTISMHINQLMILRMHGRRIDSPFDFTCFVQRFFIYRGMYLSPLPEVKRMKGDWSVIGFDEL